MTNPQFDHCIEQILKQDKEGLRQIYEEYSALIYTSVLAVIQNRQNAEDITSDFFVKLWSGASYYQPGGAHRGWLVTIARNMALDHIRKYKREVNVAEPEEVSDHVESPEKIVVGQLTVSDALALLNESEQQIVSMKVLSDMTFREIASVLKLSLGTVSWRYQSAIRRLRRGYHES